MESLLNVTCLPIIVAIVYVVMAVYKHAVSGKNDMLTRLIPVWAVILGAILGIYGYFKVPQLLLGDNMFTALLVGAVSGLSAVGFNQIGKQIIGTKEESAETVTTETENESANQDVQNT